MSQLIQIAKLGVTKNDCRPQRAVGVDNVNKNSGVRAQAVRVLPLVCFKHGAVDKPWAGGVKSGYTIHL
jgi:hypothetical protein